MRLVHVAVRAEGPTRVLCFSDSRGAALPGDEEETITKATAKLRGLQKHLQVRAASTLPSMKVITSRSTRNGSLLKAPHWTSMGSNEVMSATKAHCNSNRGQMCCGSLSNHASSGPGRRAQGAGGEAGA